MLAQPSCRSIGCTPRRMFARRSKLPDISQNMRYPSFGIIIRLRRTFATCHLLLGPLNQRKMQFRQIGYLCRPMIHLQINIQVIIAIPRRMDRITPQALQIRRQQSHTGRRNQQIPPELKIQSLQTRIILILGKSSQAAINRPILPFGRTQIQGYPIEILLIRRDMFTLKRGISLSRSLLQQPGNLSGIIRLEIIRCHTHQQDCLRGIFNRNSSVLSRHRTTFRQQHTSTSGKLHSPASCCVYSIRQLSFEPQIIPFQAQRSMFRTIHGKREIQSLLYVGCQMDHPHILRKRSKRFTYKRDTATLERRCCHRLLQIQLSTVIAHRISGIIRIINL